MRYDVAHDVSLGAIGGMVAGNVGAGPFSGGRSLQVDHVTWGDMQFTLAPKLRKDEKKKWLLDRQISGPGYGSSGYSTPNTGYPITRSTHTSTRSSGVWPTGLLLYL